MEIAFVLYPEMTALDIVGPYDVLARLQDTEPRFVASTPGPVVTDVGPKLTAAGVLDGRRATTHWITRDMLAQFGAQPMPDRVVIEDKIVTAAGVSAGIDMALTLAAMEAGEDEARAIQLVIEYDPEPPFDSGAIETAGADLSLIHI